MSAGMKNEGIPVFLSIDVEPNGFQLSNAASASWSGFETALDLARDLRRECAARTDSPVAFGWYIRTDDQLESWYGSADVIFRTFAKEIREVCDAGDYLGVHCHAVRWNDERRTWIHDFTDEAWLADCTTKSLDVFAQATGTRPSRFRAGAGFLTNTVVDALERAGVRFDLSLEPIAPWPEAFAHVPSGADDTEYLGSHPDCAGAPQEPYRPLQADFRLRAGTGARNIHLVPLTSSPYVGRGAGLATRIRARVPQLAYRRQILHLSERYNSGESYADRVARDLDRMRRPYLSIAFRTDPAGSEPFENSVHNLRALLAHPISRRLRFVDPASAVPALMEAH